MIDTNAGTKHYRNVPIVVVGKDLEGCDVYKLESANGHIIEAAAAILRVSHRRGINVVLEWNGIRTTMRPGMTTMDWYREHGLDRRVYQLDAGAAYEPWCVGQLCDTGHFSFRSRSTDVLLHVAQDEEWYATWATSPTDEHQAIVRVCGGLKQGGPIHVVLLSNGDHYKVRTKTQHGTIRLLSRVEQPKCFDVDDCIEHGINPFLDYPVIDWSDHWNTHYQIKVGERWVGAWPDGTPELVVICDTHGRLPFFSFNGVRGPPAQIENDGGLRLWCRWKANIAMLATSLRDELFEELPEDERNEVIQQIDALLASRPTHDAERNALTYYKAVLLRWSVACTEDASFVAYQTVHKLLCKVLAASV